uniref:Uncharacterized protein LOC114347774 n=1 Tax=Diabrotica virgifera virgifera TaxID=50390 RepID=A0A6P7GXR3_DIAVI
MAQFTILNSALTDCKTQINNLTDLVSAQSQIISTCVADISDLRKENQSLNNNLKALENKVIKLESKNVPTTSESVFQESYERLKRSENIIITDVPESNNTEDDISKASEILENVIPKNHFQIKSAARLGKIDLNKPRVFRITLNSRDQVLSILKNKYKVPKDKYPRVNIISDSTPQQLQLLSEVRNELTRRKDQGEENLTIKYVKGQPTIVIDGNPTITFDSINHALLWQKLYRSGVTSRILQIVKNLYQTAYFKVNASNGFSRSFDVTASVLQGETLSPLLFSLFIADIETFFYGNGARGVSIDSKNEILLLLYADDLVILADSEADVGRKLKLLESYTKSNDLTDNTTKTKILKFSKGGHTTNNINFFYNNNPVISTNSYN